MKESNNKKWESKLREIFKEEIETMGCSLEEFLGYWPTELSWDEFQEETKESRKNSERFEQLRLKFNSDDEFEQFIVVASKDATLLKPYINKEYATSFSDYINQERTRSKGSKKLINYFLDLTQKPEFRKEILKIRKKYNMPENGFPFTEEDYKKVWNDFDGGPDIHELAKRFGLYEYKWMSLISSYLFFNDAHIRKRPYYALDFELCKIIDEKKNHEKEEYTRENTGFETDEEIEDFEKMITDFKQIDDLQFPVAIRISPYASERDILDFIRRNFKLIYDIQENYKMDNDHVTIGKSKKKNTKVKERNEIIYRNRHLPSREIMKILHQNSDSKFDVDQGYIGKIISNENKKRKEV